MIAAIAGILLGLALFTAIYPLLPARPRLAVTLGEIDRTMTDESEGTSGKIAIQDKAGSWAIKHLPECMGMKADASDLQITGTTATGHTWTKIYSATFMFVSLLVLSLSAQLVLAVPLGLTLAGTTALTIAAWLSPDWELKSKAAKARAQFARGVAIFVELVAAERRRDAPPAVALENAALVGDTWIFQRIRQELVRARYDKVQPWDALERFAEKIKVPELGDASRIMRLSGDRGASVYESLRALGRGLRVRMLNEQAATESTASDKMSNIVFMVAAAFMVILLTPMVLSIM